MKRKFVQIAALCLAAALLLTLCGGTASAAPAGSNEKIIRVGLHYGTGAMEGLNLENKVASGSGTTTALTASWSWGPPPRRPSPWWRP